LELSLFDSIRRQCRIQLKGGPGPSAKLGNLQSTVIFWSMSNCRLKHCCHFSITRTWATTRNVKACTNLGKLGRRILANTTLVHQFASKHPAIEFRMAFNKYCCSCLLVSGETSSFEPGREKRTLTAPSSNVLSLFYQPSSCLPIFSVACVAQLGAGEPKEA